MPPDIWNQIASAGLPALLMGVAVWWLIKGNNQLVHELNRERSERLDRMEKHVEDCDRDRKELRDMLIKHLASE
jgi:hypothetical protein